MPHQVYYHQTIMRHFHFAFSLCHSPFFSALVLEILDKKYDGQSHDKHMGKSFLPLIPSYCHIHFCSHSFLIISVRDLAMLFAHYLSPFTDIIQRMRNLHHRIRWHFWHLCDIFVRYGKFSIWIRSIMPQISIPILDKLLPLAVPYLSQYDFLR